MGKHDTVRAEIETDPVAIGYPAVVSLEAAGAAHGMLHALTRSVWRDLPVSELAGLWELLPWNADTEPGVYVYDKLVDFAAGADGASKRVAAKALRIFNGVHVTTFEMTDEFKRAGILGMFAVLKDAGMSQASYDATIALARRLISRAEEIGLPGPEQCSIADTWEAFGWPGKIQ